MHYICIMSGDRLFIEDARRDSPPFEAFTPGGTIYFTGPGTFPSLEFTPSGTLIAIDIHNTSTSICSAEILSFELDTISMVPHSVLAQISDNDQYHFGFNGQFKDNEWAGIGNHLDFGARGYDTRTSRFISLDPDRLKYPFQSPYVYANNTPIQAIDDEGKGAGYATLLFLAKQSKSTVAIGTSASVSFGVGASVAAGMAVDPQGNVALFATGALASIDNTVFNIEKIGLGANVNGTGAILPFKDVEAISGAGFNISANMYSAAGVGGGLSADFSVSERGEVSFQGFTASLGVGTPGATVGTGGLTVGTGGLQATSAILLSGDDYHTIFDGKWDKNGAQTASNWDRGLNNSNMNNPSGFWEYTGKEMVFEKVKGEENRYSVNIKLHYAYKTSGKGAAEGAKDTQTSQTIDTGIILKKADKFTYKSENLKKEKQ